jgi:His/Glu/Gln/Arg/opine family amino acid ABC transporter permease subunit
VGEHELLFLLSGLKWTLILSSFGFAGGGVVGLLVALVRSARHRLLAGLARGYIALFQGTPLLMQLFVVYYGVALLGLKVEASTAVLLALSLHASAFLGEIWRGSIEAIPKGQTEAAEALGLHYVPRMRYVILPQALRIALPATVGLPRPAGQGHLACRDRRFHRADPCWPDHLQPDLSAAPRIRRGRCRLLRDLLAAVTARRATRNSAGEGGAVIATLRDSSEGRSQEEKVFANFLRRCWPVATLVGIAALSLSLSHAAAKAATVDEVKAKGTIIVGIQGDNPPWGFVNSTGVPDGYDADISALFAKELGVKVEYVPLAVANRIPALVTGKVDVLFATMAMTAERAKSIQYSKPYAANAIILVAAKSTKIASAADLASLEIGVPRSSAQDNCRAGKRELDPMRSNLLVLIARFGTPDFRGSAPGGERHCGSSTQ